MRVAIIGGGIGGLTLALSLHAAGLKCRIFESVNEIRALGVGINVLPHACRELTELGLQDALREIAIETKELLYFNKYGQQIWREPRGIEAGYNWPQFSIHRGEFQMLLLNAVEERLGPNAIETGHHFENFTENADGSVTLRFVDRKNGGTIREETADAVIAADGIHSRMRAIFYPNEGMPKWNGAIFWRGISDGEPFLSGRSMFMAGYQDVKFVGYPISEKARQQGKSLINWIAEIHYDNTELMEREDWNRPGKLEDFMPAFQKWVFDWLDIPTLCRNARAIYEFPMVDRDPAERWSFGAVTLLGDAAHPMYPIGSNGASQAILDARVLARELATRRDPKAAFEAYEAVRRPATAKITLSNRQNGPEQVMQMAEERAPDGFKHIHDVISQAELEEISTRYKRLAGFAKDDLNKRESFSVAPERV